MAESPRPPATHKSGSGRLLRQPTKIEYSYHWGRILGLVLLVVALGGAALYVYNQWFAAPVEDVIEVADLPQRPDQVAEEKPAPAESLPRSIPEPFGQGAGEPQTPEPDTETEVKPLWEEAIVDQALPSETEPVAELEQATIAEEPAASTLEEAATEPAEAESIDEAGVKPIYHINEMIPADTEITDAIAAPTEQPEASEPEQEIADVIPAESEAEAIETAEIEVVAETPSSPFQLQDLKIHDSGVKRFQLAEAIANKEPVGELSDIRFNPDGSTTIWVFSEVMDMRGGRLNYVWLHEGKEIARVRVRVGSNRWRSYSSKNLNQAMTGSWRVELRDGEDRLLAAAEFRFGSSE